jgi:hypothetical protein
MAPRIHTSASGIELETPVPLFRARLDPIVNASSMAVSAYGHFLLNDVIEDASALPITLVLNWRRMK